MEEEIRAFQNNIHGHNIVIVVADEVQSLKNMKELVKVLEKLIEEKDS